MTDIFFSYAREDAARVAQLADALAENGWTVWWDRSIPPGQSFDKVIETQLGQAQCVVVLWSQAALASNWVKEEAEEGLHRGILTPVLIEAVRPPLGFRRVQAADLTNWDGDRAHEGFQQLLSAIHALLDSSCGPAKGDHEAASPAVGGPGDPISSPSSAAPAGYEADAGGPESPAPVAGGSTIAVVPGRRFPLWLSPLLALLVIFTTYFVLNMLLTQDSDAVLGRMESLMRGPALTYADPQIPAPAAADNEASGFISAALAPEIAAGVLSVSSDDNHVVVRLRGDMLFRSGHAEINDRYRPTLVRVGQILTDWGLGSIEVSGHTDNIPMRTLRFPSNLQLSQARAEAVTDVIRKELPQSVDVRSMGLADSAPIVDNASAEHRALNRRVEIRIPAR